MLRLTRLVALSAPISIALACAQNPAPNPADEDFASDTAGAVTAGEIQRAPGQSLQQLLEGRVAGVTVTQTADGGIAVRIRGTTSLTGRQEPLYIVDGMEFDPGPGGSLPGLSVNDIQSIKVLKEPAETAMYGARGANGVIIVTTKRP